MSTPVHLDDDLLAQVRAWRRALHRHPETAFEEHQTAAFVADRLRALPGVTVSTGLAGTGVVASLQGSHPDPTGRAIGLRADLDALHIHEQTDLPYASTQRGRMHACGHDGHTAMLLGAAHALAAKPDFAGSVHFIFQPAEENEGGGRVMVDEGLFDQFPCDAVFGLHNWPGLPEGHIVVRPGPIMAAFDTFEITLEGQGTHAAKPHQGIDPMIPAAQLVLALQTIASRHTDPTQAVVVSVTQIHGGDTWNVIPQTVTLRGTVRALDPAVHEAVEPRLRQITHGIAAAHGCRADIRYERRYPPTVNSVAETALAQQVARGTFGHEAVITDHAPSMGSEDFAFMLQRRPGCYIWMGIGRDRPPLHNPRYDFNDAILAPGIQYWTALVHTALAPAP
ncbi:MAG: amidohydrolase [Myxococcales bacterium]|nr:amidohydrolase [Myxococcales bacterium]MCB9523715.1 amidohydrolase [Myxococcales bacterium]